ncbi:potassium voltage-gated channel protein Shaker [Elysia marginata]|uniref:Potassium voltage-gated channel protein Shaker n=1 Tax=Elysia marginata TaxID=1093978 RepID=A0AAV4HQ43_9GAST|nr:potassium voltage-gated channel protein Shaker [Elysia marginata]
MNYGLLFSSGVRCHGLRGSNVKFYVLKQEMKYSWVWCGIYFSCIVLSCVLFGLLTVETFNVPKEEFREKAEAFYAGNYTFRAIHMVTFSKSTEGLEVMEILLSIFFTLELLVRLVTCPNKREFLQDFHNMIDIFILTVQWSRFILDRIVTNDAANFTYAKSYVLVVFYCLLSCRVLRVFHLAKRLSTLRVIWLALNS